MANTSTGVVLSTIDPMWQEIRREAEAAVAQEPAVSSLMYSAVLNHEHLEDAIAARIADRLEVSDLRHLTCVMHFVKLLLINQL